jgi:hypothetical protein
VPCIDGRFRVEGLAMKSPRNAGSLLVLLIAITVVGAATAPRGGQHGLSLASMAGLDGRGGDSATPAALGRKACRFGQRYSPYYRRCVLWAPLDFS